MFSEDWNWTLLLRLFHVRHNMGNSHSTSQVFHTDISVQGPAPVLETGRALLGRDAEHMKSGSHRGHPPEDVLSPGKLSPLFRTLTSRQESPESCSVVLSTSKQRPTRPFFPLSHLLSAGKKVHKTMLHPRKMEVKDPEKCTQDSGICSCPPPWSKATRT